VRGVARATTGEDGEAHWVMILEGLPEQLPVSRRQWPAVKDAGRLSFRLTIMSRSPVDCRVSLLSKTVNSPFAYDDGAAEWGGPFRSILI
jgi:hypothetical protein